MSSIPAKQKAVQLIGPDELILNTDKDVHTPGPHQILCQVEAVGLCFSDLKLLKQFSEHARKGDIQSGIDTTILSEIPSYVSGDKPTVPGHEAVVIIVAIGDKVTDIEIGDRYLVQTDYRWLKTERSNAAFGYNFEGALQEYVLMDERVIMDPDSGQRMLIPVDDSRSASAVCLVEPWACVEDSYVTHERQSIKAGGKMIVVADEGRSIEGLAESFSPDGPPARIVAKVAEPEQRKALESLGVNLVDIEYVKTLEDAVWDDIVYFGCDAETIELLDC
ncbi:hypothetical protein LCGC14_2788580, partial [marine sediment metagenome]